MVTKDRIGGALAIVAGIIGLVLVFGNQGPGDDDDDDGPATPSTSEVAPAPGQVAPAPGGQVQQAPVPGQSQPTAPPADDDGDDDDGDDDDG